MTENDLDVLRQQAELASINGKQMMLEPVTVIELLNRTVEFEVRSSIDNHHDEDCEICDEKDEKIEDLELEISDFLKELKEDKADE